MAMLLPEGKQSFTNSAGAPLVGGKLYTYAAGTNTPKATYADAAGTTPNANPVILDARGEATVFWDGNYKVVLRDASDNIIWTVDNVSTSSGSGGGGGSGNTYTVITGDGATDNSLAIQAANIIGRQIFFFGVSLVNTPTTITVPIVDTMSQIFALNAQVTISNGLPVRPEWFGTGENTVDAAINSLPATGGTVQLAMATYRRSNYVYGFGGVGTGKYISKDNLTIRGVRMPLLATDCRSLEGGSIIQGTVIAFANNIEFRDLGVDCGKTVVDTFYGGVADPGIAEGLLLTYPDTATKAANALRRQARLHNVIGLSYSPTSLTHAVIVGEGYDQVVCTGETCGVYGIHGVVVKCSSVRAELFTAFLNGGEGVIIKSDTQTTSRVYDVEIDKIYVRAQGPTGWSPYATANTGYSILLDATGFDIDKVQIGVANVAGHPIGFGNTFGGAYSIASINVGSFICDQSGLAGTRRAVYPQSAATQFLERWYFGSIEARNTTVGLAAAFVTPGGLDMFVGVGKLTVVAATYAMDISSSSYVDIGCVSVDNLSDAIYRITGTPKLTVGSVRKDNLTPAVYSSTGGGLVPSLQNSWTQVASNDPFGIDLNGGRVCLRGLIKPGTSNQFATLPQWAWPASNKRFIAQGFNGATQVAVPVIVSSAGICNVNEVAGGFANVSSWLSLSGITYDLQA